MSDYYIDEDTVSEENKLYAKIRNEKIFVGICHIDENLLKIKIDFDEIENIYYTYSYDSDIEIYNNFEGEIKKWFTLCVDNKIKFTWIQFNNIKFKPNYRIPYHLIQFNFIPNDLLKLESININEFNNIKWSLSLY
jgi:hypothetical protein